MVWAGVSLKAALMFPESPLAIAPRQPLTSQTCSLLPVVRSFRVAVLLV